MSEELIPEMEESARYSGTTGVCVCVCACVCVHSIFVSQCVREMRVYYIAVYILHICPNTVLLEIQLMKMKEQWHQ